MRNQFTIVCRGSWLSMAQAHLFINKAQAHFPLLQFDIIIKETEGDRQQGIPLHLAEGKNFFTQDIQDYLQTGQADFAVHSMKDVSSENFFHQNFHIIIDRDNPRDIAIFNNDIIDKIKSGEKINIGTSSPRRTLMAVDFLKDALPQFNQKINITANNIRGNVDTRLQKLFDKEYDGIILAAAGLNRLLNYAPAKEKIATLLNNKKLMLLPLFECTPAPGQGAIVVETVNNNNDAIKLLKIIQHKVYNNAIQQERSLVKKYGGGCFQEFGAIHIDTEITSFTFAAGKNNEGIYFSENIFSVDDALKQLKIFSATNYMKYFFSYQFLEDVLIDENAAAYFISNHKAIHSNLLIEKIKQKKVWVAGTRTWLALAKQGIWITGSADGLGFGFLKPVFNEALFSETQNNVQIITNTNSVKHWVDDESSAIATYKLIPKTLDTIAKEISEAGMVFWTSFQQYQLYKQYTSATTKHSCPSGKTAELLLAEGLQPIIFPTIKAFIEWNKN